MTLHLWIKIRHLAAKIQRKSKTKKLKKPIEFDNQIIKLTFENRSIWYVATLYLWIQTHHLAAKSVILKIIPFSQKLRPEEKKSKQLWHTVEGKKKPGNVITTASWFGAVVSPRTYDKLFLLRLLLCISKLLSPPASRKYCAPEILQAQRRVIEKKFSFALNVARNVFYPK